MSGHNAAVTTERENASVKIRITDPAALQCILERRTHASEAVRFVVDHGFNVDMVAIRALVVPSVPCRYPERIALGVIQRMRASGSHGVDDFVAKFRADLSESIAREGGDIRVAYLLPLTVGLVEGQLPTRFRVLGIDFSVMQIGDLRSYLGSSVTPQNHLLSEAVDDLHAGCAFACCEGRDGDPGVAFLAASAAFDVLRGLIEFARSAGTFRISFGGYSLRSTVPSPRYLFRVRSSEEAEVFSFVVAPIERQFPPSPIDLDALVKTIEPFQALVAETAQAGSIQEVVADLLRLYAQAMDAPEPQSALLAFWQMAEAIALEESDRGNGDRVVTRLAFFERYMVARPDGTLRVALGGLKSKRNDLVHRGIHASIEEQEVELLKTVCEIGLKWICANSTRISTKLQLAKWWQLAGVSQKEIEATRLVCDLVVEERRRVGD